MIPDSPQQNNKRHIPQLSIKLNFADFWGGFENCNWFLSFLPNYFDIEVCDRPDFLIYSDFGDEHLRYGCTRIYFTGENRRPNFSHCDYAFTFDYLEDPRQYRLPLYRLYFPQETLTARHDVDAIFAQERKFCNMVVSNPKASERLAFFHALSRYQHIDSGGRVRNNVGGPVPDKRAFIRKYKFTLAIESSSHPGYTTEKLVEPWVEGSIPIYWGNPRVAEEFNPGSFINLHDFQTWNDAVDFIRKVDQDPDLYRQYLEAPLFPGNRMPASLTDDAIADAFANVFRHPASRPTIRKSWQQSVHALKRIKRRLVGANDRRNTE